jgi:uncharacterized membrane protein
MATFVLREMENSKFKPPVRRRWPPLRRLILAAFFVAAGINHFLNPALYYAIIPPSLPAPDTLITVSGCAEIGLGLLVLWARFMEQARYGLTALLIAVFPANIYMALRPEKYPAFPKWLLYIRLPGQLLLIAWVWWATRRSEDRAF